MVLLLRMGLRWKRKPKPWKGPGRARSGVGSSGGFGHNTHPPGIEAPTPGLLQTPQGWPRLAPGQLCLLVAGLSSSPPIRQPPDRNRRWRLYRNLEIPQTGLTNDDDATGVALRLSEHVCRPRLTFLASTM